MVGEAWTVIAGKGVAFQNIHSPQVVVRVGTAGSIGAMEITDIVFSTVGPCEQFLFACVRYLLTAIIIQLEVPSSSSGISNSLRKVLLACGIRTLGPSSE